jgi:dipeptidyl aminopeptidase/acylaminoacyl peptidase
MIDTISLAALHALVTLSSPEISPDGTKIAYVRSVRDYKDDRNVESLVLIGIDGRGRRTIDSGPFVSAPRWAPDGGRLAYLRHTVKNDNDQIVVYRLAAGAAVAVTHAGNGVQHYAWSPNGAQFVFTTPDDEPNAAAAKRHDDLFTIGDDNFLATQPLVPSHLWLVPSTGGAAKQLTHGAWTVFEGVAPFAGAPVDPSWSADGRHIVIARVPDAHDATTDRTSIAIVDAKTGQTHDVGSLRAYAYEPVFAPTGSSFAYIRPHGPGPISEFDLVVASAANGDGIDVTAHLDRDVQSVQWAGNTLVMTVPDGMQRAIYELKPGGSPRRVDIGALQTYDVGAGPRGELAFVGSTLTHAPELYVVRSPGAKPVALTRSNASISTLRYGRSETITWTAADGQKSEGLLFHPVDERAGRTYPLVVWHHGGPEFAIDDAFDEGTDEGYPFGALAAAHDWFVLLPNYRGSDDLGSAHEHAIYKDPGVGPMSDTMAGLDAVEKSEPIDTTHVCVGGHSYGGFMTSWIIGHDSRWTCAIVADGAVDWTEGYDLSGVGNLAWVRDSLGGSPWRSDMAKVYRDDSPISYATQVKTPTLLITGLRDEVVPFPESWEYFHALRDNNVPVKLVGIPTSHHTPSDPVRLNAYEQTIFNWLAHYLP